MNKRRRFKCKRRRLANKVLEIKRQKKIQHYYAMYRMLGIK